MTVYEQRTGEELELPELEGWPGGLIGGGFEALHALWGDPEELRPATPACGPASANHDRALSAVWEVWDLNP